jgi:hypothetical protein
MVLNEMFFLTASLFGDVQSHLPYLESGTLFGATLLALFDS